MAQRPPRGRRHRPPDLDHASRLKRARRAGCADCPGAGATRPSGAGVLITSTPVLFPAQAFTNACIVVRCAQRPKLSGSACAICSYVQRRCRNWRINSAYGSSLLRAALASAVARNAVILSSRFTPRCRRQRRGSSEPNRSISEQIGDHRYLSGRRAPTTSDPNRHRQNPSEEI
jgi:hypothetical protein